VTTGRASLLERLAAGWSLAGLLGAALAWWASLYPTFIPRDWLVQAVVSGVSAAIGYGIGALVARAVSLLGIRASAVSRWLPIVVLALWLLALVAGAIVWLAWQNELRELMGMPLVGVLDALLAAGVSVVIGALLVVVGRWVGRGIGALHRFISRFMPGWLAAPATLVLIVVLLVLLGGGVVWRGLTAGASAIFAPVDADTNPGTVQPTSSTVSGGPGSLVSWDTLGRWGRDFVAHAVSSDELAAFHGEDVTLAEPVRVYVGVAQAETADARADLAVQELERTGGFDRAVLAVWIPTGSGWVEPHAAESFEMLHAGDTAIVAIQYSYLPSLLAFFMDPGGSVDAGLALFSAVRERWEELPETDRPQLVVFGMSLGTAGAEAPFIGADVESSVANLAAKTDGALLVGAKFQNTILEQLTAARDPGSPVWEPVFDAGETARFVAPGPDLAPFDPTWNAPRVVYLQHPSDPVPFWGVEHVWSPPEWMDAPRGFAVPAQATWFPIVSGVGAVADLIGQLSTPPGFGHVYDRDYLDAWARVVPPAGWTDADTRQLETFLFDDAD
jgi:uncharacterized membrane protein